MKHNGDNPLNEYEVDKATKKRNIKCAPSSAGLKSEPRKTWMALFLPRLTDLFNDVHEVS